MSGRDQRPEGESAVTAEEGKTAEKSYRQLQAIVEASRDAIWSWTPDGIIDSWNSEAERLLQYKAEEIIGQSLFDLVAPERVERAREIVSKLLEGNWYEQYDTVRLRKDGVAVPVELTVAPIRDATGIVVGAATVCRDITARKAQERALRASEERFSKLFHLAPIALSVSTLDEGRYLAVNSALLEMTGYNRDEVVGHTARELLVYSDQGDFRRIRQLLAKSNSVRGVELGLRGKSGDVRTALFSADVIDLSGQDCLLAAVVDITERKAAEQAVAASEARLRAVLESLYDGVAAVNAEGRPLFVNDAMARLLGFVNSSELPKVGLKDALTRIEAANEDGAPLRYEQRPLVRALAGETVIDQPIRMRQPAQNREYDVLNTAIPVRDASGNVTMAVVRMRDITQSKKAEAALRESEARYRTLVENANDIVATLDLDFRFTSANPAVERILGYSPTEMIGQPLSRFVPKDQYATHKEMLAQKLKGASETRYDMQLLGKGDRPFTLEVSSKLLLGADNTPIGIHAIARDITERKEAEARQEVLIRELQHRTKNMLAVIQAITTQTLTRSESVESAQEALRGRLHALANAQEFIAVGAGSGASLRELIEAELASFGTRASLEGPTLFVSGRFAHTLALVVHELATNAIKHGAMSAEDGRVAIAWTIDCAADEPMFCLSWDEFDGPRVEPPLRAGFGTQVLRMAGEASLSYNKNGLSYRLIVPLSEVVEGPNIAKT